MEYLVLRCSKCNKKVETIYEPCPHCGYQLPLTKAGKKRQRELRERKGSK